MSAGILSAIEGLQRAAQTEGVKEVKIYFEEGQFIPELRDSADRAGYVIAEAASSQSALDQAQITISCINFQIQS